MKILYGLASPDGGSMEIDGEGFAPAGPREALARGIGMVHQHFMLVPTLTVAENAVLGDEPMRGGVFVDRAAAVRTVEDVARRYGLALDPHATVEGLSVGEKQRLEILKVLMRGARILILDEPTAVLAPSESRALFQTVRALTDEGASVIFITHRLHEVVEHADRVTVMRRGRLVETLDASATDEASLACRMVGRELLTRTVGASPALGGEILRVAHDSDAGGRAQEGRLKDVSLSVRAGEIVGIAGVEGNGQRELAEVLGGLRAFRGTVTIDGRSIERLGPRGVHRLGLAHIPEDRTVAGTIAPMTIWENLLLGREDEARFRRGLSFDFGRVRAFAAERIAAFDVRPPDPDALVSELSGGNQQKVVISRETDGAPRVLIASHPTRGVDVGAQEAIHDAILDQRDRGAAVLLISADLGEVRELSDRILVLFAGRISGEFARGEADEEMIGLHMVGSAGAAA
jgi:simple sugar transport system ATP-binding protein